MLKQVQHDPGYSAQHDVRHDLVEFKRQVQTLAMEIGVKVREIHLRPMKRKLASCSTGGRLTFDVSLLSEAKEAQAKAILHELLHLRYPNHGKMFNRVLESYTRKIIPASPRGNPNG